METRPIEEPKKPEKELANERSPLARKELATVEEAPPKFFYRPIIDTD